MNCLQSMNAVFTTLAAVAILKATPSSSSENGKLKSDVTIYLSSPILSDGGTVIVLPKAISQDLWRKKSDLPNPAPSDKRLEIERPISNDDQRLSVIVSSNKSVVSFDYPEGGGYDFRFLPIIGSDYPVDNLRTKMIGVGTGGDIHPLTGEEVDIGSIRTIYVLGRSADEGASRNFEATTRLGFLNERYECRNFAHAIACDASKDNLDE